jgi:hypothetical protein
MAWLSDALHSPAKDFLHTAGLPFVRPDGVRIADDWTTWSRTARTTGSS